jgi:hypothetical protein
MTTRTPGPGGDWLVAGGFVHIHASLSDQAEDVIDSLLLAQLSADRQASRFTTPTSWVQAFESVLSNIGWMIDQRDTGRSSADQHPAGPGDVVPLDTIISRLQTVLSPEQAVALRSAVAGLATAAEPVANWWRQQTLAGNTASSTICFAAQVQRAPWLAVSCNALTAPAAITGYPWTGVPADGVEFTVSQATAVVNEAVFSSVRAGIRTKVAPVRESHVVDVNA